MSYKNCHSVGYQVERCLSCGGDYNINSHGDIGAFYNSVHNADLPMYTARFYHPSQHEMLAELKYGKVELGYNEGLRDMHEMVQGAPLEAYIPKSLLIDGPTSASPSIMIRNAEIIPKQSVVDEITRAQAEILGKIPEGSVLIRATEIEQDIHIRRRIRRIEIIRKQD